MAKPVPFIDREDELALIDELIGEGETEQVVCINAPGGIGKTRLLQEVQQRYAKKDREEVPLIVTDIIDFDDRTFHISHNLGLHIAQVLDKRTFEPYLQALLDWRRMAMAGVSIDRLTDAGLEVDQAFVDCFNKLSAQRRVVLLVDTIEALEGTDVWNYVIGLGLELRNSVLLIAGRSARKIAEALHPTLGNNAHIIDLQPLAQSASESYFLKKQELLHAAVEPELVQKILFLAAGRPILIDLALEWLTREVPLDWLLTSSMEELKEQQGEFERQLVRHIADTRQLMDWLVLMMSHVYPLNEDMIMKLLAVPENEARELFEEAQTYAFVRRLPDGRISLHDEMRRMVNEYVWPEVDKDGDRQRRDSRLAVEYLEGANQSLAQRMEELEAEEEKAREEANAQAELSAFRRRETLERELWIQKAQLLDHMLIADFARGAELFAEMFDEATRVYRFLFRDTLLKRMQEYANRLSPEQKYELDSRRAKQLLDYGEYLQASDLATEILETRIILPTQQVEMLIQRGNVEIRLGNTEKGLADFEEAVRISEENSLPLWLIKAKNAVGWAYRLNGQLDLATQHYRVAKALCQQQGVLEDDYGWILNNLTFVLMYQDHKSAIDFGRAAVDHWRSIGNEIGLGAAYSVLGITYYQTGRFDQALDTFQNALNIFEPLKLRDWIGQVLSWRGATYIRLGEFAKAENDLNESLATGSRTTRAMSLNRLGRLYFSKEEWDLAEGYLQEGFGLIGDGSDFGYSFGSLAKLIFIAAIRKEYDRMDEFSQKLQDCVDKVRASDEHDLGDAYFGMAELALGKRNVNQVIEFLDQGISLTIESGAYGRTDVLSKLTNIEQNFEQIDLDAVHQIGRTLKEIFAEKEVQNIAYGAITPIMFKWADWEVE